MAHVRTRFKILAWLALAFTGVVIAHVAGPMYAQSYWPDELSPDNIAKALVKDFNEMVLAVEKAKPIIATANTITGIGQFMTFVAIIGLCWTSFKHFRQCKRAASSDSDYQEQPTQNSV